MTTPGQEIDAYLDSSGTAEPERLNVAILFARSMLRELRDSAAVWERTACALEEIRQQQQQTAGENHPCTNVEWPCDPVPSAARRPRSRGAHT